MRSATFGYLAALGATILWAGNFVAARGLAEAIPPIQLNFWRWVTAFVCMLPLALPKLRADWPHFRKHAGYLAFMGFVSVTALNALIYKAGQTTESLNMALLVPSAPVMIMALARVVYGEPMPPRRLLGLATVLCGVLTLISRGNWENLLSVRLTVGDLWALGGAACFAVYSLFTRKRPPEISVEGFNIATFALGLLFSLPPLFWEMRALPAPVWNTPVITGILYTGIGCSFAAYLLWTRAIGSIGPVNAGMIYYALPLFAAVESVLILGETVAPAHILGGGLIVTGIMTAAVPARR